MDKVGVLVMRVWMENPRPSGLRVRLTHTLDVTGIEAAVSAAAGIDDATRFVHGWLEAFVSGSPVAGDARTNLTG
jgi:hypothetical protein